MTISELNAGQGNVNVEGTITEVGEGRTFSKFGKEMTVANAILKDDSGTIKLTLWNEDASKYKEGDKIKIENGYVNEFQGEKQLTAGKFGKMEKVGEGEGEGEGIVEKIKDVVEDVIEDLTEDKEESKDKSKDKDKEEDAEDTKVDESAVEDADGTPDEKPVEETEDQKEAVI